MVTIVAGGRTNWSRPAALYRGCAKIRGWRMRGVIIRVTGLVNGVTRSRKGARVGIIARYAERDGVVIFDYVVK